MASTPPELASFICSYFSSQPLLVVHVLVPKGFRSTHWRPVVAPMIKENFNATFRGRTSSSCSRVVIRDCQGLVFRASTRRHQYVSSPFAVETLAFLTMTIFAVTSTSLRDFSKATVRHCFWEQNLVAHLLAALGFQWEEDQFWMEEVPFQVELAVVAKVE
ncbi:hypothetical protein Goshw_024645 [Gossypium schwendimanii]|uniref:RNase H type-1 domain-containing protein n=1 Tax=Gossypium schwendimanii TaxID=34291 RepID=A0A7J9MYP8_GOSSC|nr:hypothetical protein [Gossypium schwendimanii]